MKQPLLSGEAFLADVTAARREPGRMHLWWLGQSGFLVLWNNSGLLLDPYLSDSLTTKYAGTATPHERMTGRVIAPEQLDFISVVTSSHNHTDHLDAATLRPLLAANPGMTLLVSSANQATAAERLGVAPDRLTPISMANPVTLNDWTFHAVPAAHETLSTNADGEHETIGLVVTAGPWTLYHSGDTVRYEGLADRLRPYGIDVAMLPINGRAPERGVAGNLSGPEAVALAGDAGIGAVIPCHYDMFAFNTASPDAFVAAAEAAGQPYRVMQNGERWTLSPRA